MIIFFRSHCINHTTQKQLWTHKNRKVYLPIPTFVIHTIQCGVLFNTTYMNNKGWIGVVVPFQAASIKRERENQIKLYFPLYQWSKPHKNCGGSLYWRYFNLFFVAEKSTHKGIKFVPFFTFFHPMKNIWDGATFDRQHGSSCGVWGYSFTDFLSKLSISLTYNITG